MKLNREMLFSRNLDLDLVHPEQWRDGSRGVVNVFRFQEDVRDL